MKTETRSQKPKRSPYPREIEQLRKLKPLEQLVMAKSALLVELESELENPKLTQRSRKLIQNKIEQIERQNLEIIQLIQTLERQLPSPGSGSKRKKATPTVHDPAPAPAPAPSTPLPDTSIEIDSSSVRDLAPESFSFKKGILVVAFMALLFQARTIGEWSAFHTRQVIDRMVSGVQASLFSNRSPAWESGPATVVTLDATDGFDGESLRLNSAFFKKAERNLSNHSPKTIHRVEIEIHSVIPGGSARDSSNLRFHRKLTQTRAEALVRALKRSGSFDSVEFKATGKGADERLGRKAIIRIHSGS